MDCFWSIGFTKYVPIDENHPLQAQSPYAATKIAADKLAESFYKSFNLPIIGSVGLIDVINYMTHAGGLKISKKGFAAIGASKFVAGVLPSIGPIQLPTSTSATSSIGSNPSSGAPI